VKAVFADTFYWAALTRIHPASEIMSAELSPN
jgi:hypothetical protein